MNKKHQFHQNDGVKIPEYIPRCGRMILFQDSGAHPIRNKTDSLPAFVWNRKASLKYISSIHLISWTYYTGVSKVIFHWISPCIWKQNNSHLKISLPASFLQNPLTVWVFLATEIASDYSVKCSSGENCMFQDACTIQLSNIHTVMILKESTQCREMDNKIKSSGMHWEKAAKGFLPDIPNPRDRKLKTMPEYQCLSQGMACFLKQNFKFYLHGSSRRLL